MRGLIVEDDVTEPEDATITHTTIIIIKIRTTIITTCITVDLLK